MAKLVLTINLFDLGKRKLNLNEYLTLMKLEHELDNRDFPFVKDDRFYPRLLDDGLIEQNESGIYVLTKAGLGVFRPEHDRFEEFYALFPSKVETGFGFRAISTVSPDTVTGRNARTIWNRVTKNKPDLQDTIIACLRRELAHKKSTGSLAYMQNVETWLNQATWEKWEDIPDKNESSGYRQL